MLVARSDWTHGASRMRATVFLGEELRAQLVHREHLVFDSRYAYSPCAPRGVATLLMVRRGVVETSSGARSTGRAIWILRESELERVEADAVSFRAWGEPFHAINLVMPRSRVRAPVGLDHAPVVGSASTWAAFDALAAGDSEPEPRVVALLRALASDRLIDATVAASVRRDESPAMRRLWSAVADRYAEHDTSVYTDLFATLAGLSPRQIARDLREISTRFGLFGGFRSTVRTLRLRRAVLLLSAPSMSVSDVAHAVGYGSVDAMGRAFRDARLPPPHLVRDDLLTTHAAPDASAPTPGVERGGSA